jgi:hypothetical protein
LLFSFDNVFPVDSRTSCCIVVFNFLKNECGIESLKFFLGILEHFSIRSDLLNDHRVHLWELSFPFGFRLFDLIGDTLSKILESWIEKCLWVNSFFFVRFSQVEAVNEI